MKDIFKECLSILIGFLIVKFIFSNCNSFNSISV